MTVNIEKLERINFEEAFEPLKPRGWEEDTALMKSALIKLAGMTYHPILGDFRYHLLVFVRMRMSDANQIDTAIKLLDVATKSGVFSEGFTPITLGELLCNRVLHKLPINDYLQMRTGLRISDDKDSMNQYAAIMLGCGQVALELRKHAEEENKVPLITLFSAALECGHIELARKLCTEHEDEIKQEIEDQAMFASGEWSHILPIASAISAQEFHYIDLFISWGYNLAWEEPIRYHERSSWPVFAAATIGNIAVLDKLFEEELECIADDECNKPRHVIEAYIDEKKNFVDFDVLDKLVSREEVKPFIESGRYFAYAACEKEMKSFDYFMRNGAHLSTFFSLPDQEESAKKKTLYAIGENIGMFKPFLRDEDFPILFAQSLRIGQSLDFDCACLIDKILSSRKIYEEDADNVCSLRWEGMEGATQQVKLATQVDKHLEAVTEQIGHIQRTFGSFENLSLLINEFPYAAGKGLQNPEYITFIKDAKKSFEYLAGCFGVYDVGGIIDTWVKKWDFESLRFATILPIDHEKLWPPLLENAQEPLPIQMLHTFFDDLTKSTKEGESPIHTFPNEAVHKQVSRGISAIINAITQSHAVTGMPNAQTDPEEHRTWCEEFAKDLGIVLAAAQGDNDKKLSVILEFGRAGNVCATAWRETVNHFYDLWVEKRAVDIPSRVYEEIAKKASSIVDETAQELKSQVALGSQIHLPNYIAHVFTNIFGIKPRRYIYHDPTFAFNKDAVRKILRKKWHHPTSYVEIFQSLDQKLRESQDVLMRDWVLDNIPEFFTSAALDLLNSRFSPYTQGQNLRDALLKKGVVMSGREDPQEAIARKLLIDALQSRKDHSYWNAFSIESGYCFEKRFTARHSESFEEALYRKTVARLIRETTEMDTEKAAHQFSHLLPNTSEDRSKKRHVEVSKEQLLEWAEKLDSGLETVMSGAVAIPEGYNPLEKEVFALKELYLEDVKRGRAQWSCAMQADAKSYLLMPGVKAEYAPILSLPDIENDCQEHDLLRTKPNDTLEDRLATARREMYGELITNDDGSVNTRGIWGVMAENKWIGIKQQDDTTDRLALPARDCTQDIRENKFLLHILKEMPQKETQEIRRSITEFHTEVALASMQIDPLL